MIGIFTYASFSYKITRSYRIIFFSQSVKSKYFYMKIGANEEFAKKVERKQK